MDLQDDGTKNILVNPSLISENMILILLIRGSTAVAEADLLMQIEFITPPEIDLIQVL
jgi:hypothetical protein